MSEPTAHQAWAVRADQEYLLSRSALRRKAPLLYGATFHAQPWAEKYLQTLLVAHGRPFPRTHGLAALHDVCMQADRHIPIEVEQLERVNAYAVQVRYPGDDPTLEEAREAVEIARSVRRWTRSVLRSIARERES